MGFEEVCGIIDLFYQVQQVFVNMMGFWSAPWYIH